MLANRSHSVTFELGAFMHRAVDATRSRIEMHLVSRRRQVVEIAGSFLDDPVIGAYVTGNPTVGIRQQSMGNLTWTYNDVKTSRLAEIHDVGELWAATLWTIRNGIGAVGTGTGVGALGAATTEALVVQGMKLTPCHPTMLQARDGILIADELLNGGANRCKLYRAFASRLMGTGASSPNESSTSTIVTSDAVPIECTTDGP